jgi:hypothetical protein
MPTLHTYFESASAIEVEMFMVASQEFAQGLLF